jgi:hypothetical protein
VRLSISLKKDLSFRFLFDREHGIIFPVLTFQSKTIFHFYCNGIDTVIGDWRCRTPSSRQIQLPQLQILSVAKRRPSPFSEKVTLDSVSTTLL